MKFTDVGIKSIIFTIHPTYEFNLPLDIVFKLIHATQDIPLIKMNLSKVVDFRRRLSRSGVSPDIERLESAGLRLGAYGSERRQCPSPF